MSDSEDDADAVDFINGATRLYGIVGDPIEQVRSPEMVTRELLNRGLDAILVPLHVATAEFESVLPSLMKLRNLDGLIFTIPFKARALALAHDVGPQARVIGGFNAMVRRSGGTWAGEMFDGLGCVEAFSRRGFSIQGKRLMLIGLGGAGSAIGAAMAAQKPGLLRLFDVDRARCERMAGIVANISPSTDVEIGEPLVEGVDVLFNATPLGMLGDARMPIEATRLPAELIVFDAVVKPEVTPLLALAQACGCRTVGGREMMRGQISRIVDWFIAQQG
ncbi:MAG TPA: shikimate dehydrogenase [Casimicrobiaceae bacterium]|nr:shikimate dehydrogenase [Casimicrobiaceae bacterium]